VQTGLHLKIDVDTKVMANIDQAMQGDKKPYYSAAIYYYNNNKDLNKALEWMEAQDKSQPNSDNIKYWIARIKLKMGDKKGAIAIATEGLNLATKAKDVEYARMNKEVLADAAK
jgi:tetratricopeptide (TPR) repeat protein